MSARFGELSRLLRTVRPLRREQLLARLLHEARQVTFRRVPQLLAWQLVRSGEPPEVAVRVAPRPRDASARALAARQLDERSAWLAGRQVAPNAWDDASLPKLVRYHLHYLDVARAWADAATVSAPEPDGAPVGPLWEAALALVQEWSAAHPPKGSEAWEPFPVSARLLNLVALAGRLGTSAPAWLRAMLATHARFVSRFPERHLLANHLLKNWAALAAAGLLLQGEEAARWEAQGLAGLEAELSEQLLADGGHYERSAMYHLLVLADLLDVRDVARARNRHVPWLDAAVERMAGYLGAVLHPDGDIPLFNDAVLGQAPLPAEVFARLGTVPAPAGARIFDAKESGLFVLRPGREEALVFDAGPLGPDYQPGHAHSDTLSFELSVGGERRAVNGGVDGYQSPHRAFYRSAVAHNTVTVNGEGPDELWGTFRVGGRSKVVARKAMDCIDFLAVRASLEAFQGWTHERAALLFPRRALVVLDWVSAREESFVVSRARLVPGGTSLRFVPLSGLPSQRTTAYAPEFGRVFEASEHSVQARGQRVRLGYALLWGAAEVAIRERVGALEVVLEGQPYRLPVS